MQTDNASQRDEKQSKSRSGRTNATSTRRRTVRTQPDKSSRSSSSIPDGKPSGPQKPKVVPVLAMEINLSVLLRNLILLSLIGFVLIPFVISLFGTPVKDITLSDFVRDLREHKITEIKVAGDELRLTYDERFITDSFPHRYRVRKASDDSILDLLGAAQVDLTTADLSIVDLSWSHLLMETLVTMLPLLVMVAFFYFIFRQNRTGDVFGMGRSKAKVFVKGKQNVKFADVGGMTEAKKELEEIVDFLKNSKKYAKVGARTPKGVLLVGPAGTGKTLLARAVAGEADVQFLSIAGSEFMEMLVGVGASRVRDLFDTAKKSAPSIIFIDEIDAIGRMRVGGGVGGHDEREQTLNQILVEMDGFDHNENVIVIAATNRGDMLDPALVRPGRFDRRVMVSLPDLAERKFILDIHKKGKPFAANVDWEQVAKMTTGFSGADLENMLNEAAISVVRHHRSEITMEDISDASIKVKLGPSKKRLTDEYERRLTAYHELGHAIVSHLLPHADPVSRISIISRGSALGYTITPPNRDKMQLTKSEILDEICVLLGGRVAEELVFSELTAGASSDISRATKMARRMVEEWGMSPLGPIYLAPQFEDSDYARAFEQPRQVSPELASKVDREIHQIVDEAYKRTTRMLTRYRAKLDELAAVLLEKETLEGSEFSRLMGEQKASAA